MFYYLYQPDDNLLVVGMADGLLSIQKRKTDDAKVKTKPKKKTSFRYVTTGKTYTAHSVWNVLFIFYLKKKFNEFFLIWAYYSRYSASLLWILQIT